MCLNCAGFDSLQCFLRPGATVFSTGLNLLLAGLAMAAWACWNILLPLSFGRNVWRDFFFQTYFRLLLRSFYVKEQGCSLRRERWVFAVVAPWANVTSTDWCIFNGWKFMLCCSSPGLNEETPLLFPKYVLVCLLICRFCFHYLYKYHHKRKTYFKRLPCATFLRENSPVNVPRSLSNGERVLLKWQLKLINASAKVSTS